MGSGVRVSRGGDEQLHASGPQRFHARRAGAHIVLAGDLVGGLVQRSVQRGCVYGRFRWQRLACPSRCAGSCEMDCGTIL